MVRFKNYAALDQAPVLSSLFHPRREEGRVADKHRDDVKILVGQGVEVGASFHFKHRDAPVILFFHGNGEIVSDYDELGVYFLDMGVNFFVVDYRGYGSSSGSPTFSDMMGDSHILLDFLISYMGKKKMTGSISVMGRSLGSASAIELGAHAVHSLKSLMIESGFALVAPLLRTLGIDPVSTGFREEEGFENLDKIKKIAIPCLVIHATLDQLIPFAQGKALFDACPSDTKFLLEIKEANHNDIFYRGMASYLTQVKKFSFLSQT